MEIYSVINRLRTTKQNIADLIETIVTKNNIKLEEDIKQIINQVKNY